MFTWKPRVKKEVRKGCKLTTHPPSRFFYLFLVFLTGTIWSFGGLIVRHMVSAQDYQWQYLFFRGLMVASILILFMVGTKPATFLNRLRDTSRTDMIGALSLALAMFGFILSITMTTVANTLFMLAAAPFIAAFLGIVLLKERISPITWVAMSIAFVGIVTMVTEGLTAGNLAGNLLALLSASGFAVFTVCLKMGSETQKFTVAAMAGILCCILTLLILFFRDDTLVMPLRNIYLSMLHGCVVGGGLILFSIGARHIPAAQATLMSLMEIVGGVFWVYLPIFGINEVPSALTLIGGIILLGAILLDALWALLHRR